MTTIGSDVRTQFVPQEMLDAIAATAKAKGMSDEQVSRLQLAAQRLFDQGGAAGPALEQPDAGAALLRDAQEIKVFNQALFGITDNLQGDIANFMALFMKYAQESRKQARTDREAQLTLEVQSRENAIAQMKDAADKRFTAACIEGGMQIGAGVVSAAASIYAARQEAKAFGADREAAGVRDSAIGAPKGEIKDNLNNLADAWEKSAKHTREVSRIVEQGINAGGQMAQGAGKIGAGKVANQADEADQAKARFEIEAKMREESKARAQEEMQQMMDIIRDIREKLAAIEQSNVEANRTISGNIR